MHLLPVLNIRAKAGGLSIEKYRVRTERPPPTITTSAMSSGLRHEVVSLLLTAAAIRA